MAIAKTSTTITWGSPGSFWIWYGYVNVCQWCSTFIPNRFWIWLSINTNWIWSVPFIAWQSHEYIVFWKVLNHMVVPNSPYLGKVSILLWEFFLELQLLFLWSFLSYPMCSSKTNDVVMETGWTVAGPTWQTHCRFTWSTDTPSRSAIVNQGFL